MKTIVITGANGFLGTATVKKFLNEGYEVIGIDHSDTHLSFAKAHPQFSFLSTDLGNETGVATLVDDLIKKHGRIDGALMIAGGFAMGSISETDGTLLHQQIALNFETAYHLARPLAKHMAAQQYGCLVFIGARPALVPDNGKYMVAYSLSKSLLFRLAELINAEHKDKNVVASVVVPSTIDTPVNRKSMPDVDPANWVQPSQIADLLEFICSDKGLPIREPVYKIYGNS